MRQAEWKRFRGTMAWRRAWGVARLLLVAYGLLSAGTTEAQDMRAPARTPNRLVSKYIWSYKELRERQIVMQKLDYSCGAASLATIAHYYWGDDVGERKFLTLMPKLKLTQTEMKDRIEKGLTLTDLRDLAEFAGYEAYMLKPTFSELAKAKVPVVVGITINKHDHFAVFRGTDGAWIYLADPIRGNIRTPIPVFLEQWQKPHHMLVLDKPGADVKDINPMGVRQDEVDRGVLNDFTMNKNGLTPIIPNPLRINN